MWDSGSVPWKGTFIMIDGMNPALWSKLRLFLHVALVSLARNSFFVDVFFSGGQRHSFNDVKTVHQVEGDERSQKKGLAVDQKKVGCIGNLRIIVTQAYLFSYSFSIPWIIRFLINSQNFSPSKLVSIPLYQILSISTGIFFCKCWGHTGFSSLRNGSFTRIVLKLRCDKIRR